MRFKGVASFDKIYYTNLSPSELTPLKCGFKKL